MEFVFNVDKDGLTGTVKYKLPTAMERLQLSKYCNYDFKDGEIQEIHVVDRAFRIIEKAKEYITHVDCKAGDYSFNDFESLSTDSRGSEVIAEIAGRLISGTMLGKS